MRWPNLAAVALGIVAAVAAHYLPDVGALLNVTSGTLLGLAFPQLSPPPRVQTPPPA
jgi:hypothetical protein